MILWTLFALSSTSSTDADAMLELWKKTMKNYGGTKLNTKYHHAYAQHFKPYEYQNVTLLEIGANYGDSLYAWAMYFKNAHQIWGLRYNVKPKTQRSCTAGSMCDKINIYDGDQSSFNDLMGLTRASLKIEIAPSGIKDEKWMQTGYNIVIDDGSHVPEHMLFSFKTLFPYLKPGGLYVIEDIAFSYADFPTHVYGYKVEDQGIGRPHSLIEKFKQAADLVNRFHCFQDLDIVVFDKTIDEQIQQVSFTSGMIFVWKKTTEQMIDIPGSINKRMASLPWTKHANGPAFSAYKRWLKETNRHTGVTTH